MSATEEVSFVFSKSHAGSVLRPEIIKGSPEVYFRLNCFVICQKSTGEVFCVTDIVKNPSILPYKDVEVKLAARERDIIVVEFPGGKNPKLKQIIGALPPERRKLVRPGIRRWYSSKPIPDNFLSKHEI